MRYRDLILPELRPIAKHIPFNRAVIVCAGFALPLSLALTGLPEGITHRRIRLRGHRGLPFSTDIFEPEGAAGPLPALIDLHGGAFCYKASPCHKKLACLYALRANCRVFFPDYHLAPAYPFPAAYEDALSLYRHILANAGALRVDPERIGLAGDSAGGCLSALLGLRWAREGLALPCLQLLVYPATDGLMQTDSMRRFPDTPLWNARSNRRMWAYYCPGQTEELLREASPLHVPLPDAIPASYVETAEFDCLHDEGVLYAERLRKAGAEVECNETKGTFHGYDSALGTGVAAESIQKRIAFLQRGFAHRDAP